MTTRLRKLLEDCEIPTPGPTIDDVTACNNNWSIEDIQHYLRTEQDPRRLAIWCQLYLNLPY